MSVSPRARASQMNGRKSGGPKTTLGKARSAQNARRHGLSLSVMQDPSQSAAVEGLARQLVEDNSATGTLDAARRIAEAQIDLTRIRQARRALMEDAEARIKAPSARDQKKVLTSQMRLLKKINRALDTPKLGNPDNQSLEALMQLYDNSRAEPAPPDLASGIGVLASALLRLERYERRALSRRKFAIRELDAAILAQGQKELGASEGSEERKT